MKFGFFICVVIIFISVKVIGQNNFNCSKVDNRIDSLFVANFKKMDYLIQGDLPIDDTSVDRNFVKLLVVLSGINCHAIDYSGFCHFTNKELKLWKKWYLKNKDDLDSKMIFRWLYFMRKKNKSQEEIEELEDLF